MVVSEKQLSSQSKYSFTSLLVKIFTGVFSVYLQTTRKKNVIALLHFEKPFEKDVLWFDPFIIFRENIFRLFN